MHTWPCIAAYYIASHHEATNPNIISYTNTSAGCSCGRGLLGDGGCDVFIVAKDVRGGQCASRAHPHLHSMHMRWLTHTYEKECVLSRIPFRLTQTRECNWYTRACIHRMRSNHYHHTHTHPPTHHTHPYQYCPTTEILMNDEGFDINWRVQGLENDDDDEED